MDEAGKNRRVNQVIDKALAGQARRMTVREVEERVIKLAGEWETHQDDESCRNRENDLHREVLAAIAAGAKNPAALASAALRTLEIGFARWSG